MELNGTTYHEETPKELAELLEKIRLEGTRCKFHYGDVETGEPWGDVETGTLGRSMGPTKIPIVLCSKTSTGGGGLLDHCIVKVTKSRGGDTIYRVDKPYKLDEEKP